MPKGLVLAAAGVFVVLASMSTAAQAAGGGRAAAACSNETVTVFGKSIRLRLVLHGNVSCNEARRTIRTYFRQATFRRCRAAGNICGLEVPGGWTCALAGAASEAPLIAGCFRSGARVKVYEVTRSPKAVTPLRVSADAPSRFVGAFRRYAIHTFTGYAGGFS
jgi:hypothetical protein